MATVPASAQAASRTAQHAWRPPSRWQIWSDGAFRKLCVGFAVFTVVLLFGLVVQITAEAIPAFKQFGFGFLTGTSWDPNTDTYAILPEIWGTLYTSLLAMLIGSVFGVAAAIFLSEGYMSDAVYSVLKRLNLHLSPFWNELPERMEGVLKDLIELLAAVPSVVYGLWGIFIIIPLIRPWCNMLHAQLGWFPLFSTSLSGPGIFPASFVLAIMVLPTITAISRDSLAAVPPKLRMAAYGLGATRWETILGVLIPTASKGIFGGIVLAFGRALGETMALAMLAGNAGRLTLSLFSPGNTLAALLANSFPEAGPREIPILMYASLVLLAITLAVNIVGATILTRAEAEVESK